jgi:hypothetical protein
MRNPRPFTSSGEIALKIYGERNTGTNYLAMLTEHNLCARVLPGRVDDHDTLTQLTRRLSRFLPALTHRWHEAARDRFFEASFNDNLGWKHMNPDPDRIGPDALASVRFLMVVKNPYAWLLSLYQRPYHVGARDTRFEEFLQRHLMVMQRRENIGPDPLQPVEIWNRKMRGYMRLREEADHAVIVRYEDFLTDEMGTLERVAAELGIAMRDRYVPVLEGVKNDDMEISHTDYADYYLSESWRRKLSPEALEIINAMLAPEIVEAFGYEIIDSANLRH